MSNHTVVFVRDDVGEVGRHGAEWYTFRAGHRLCVDLAKEIESLRAEIVVLRQSSRDAVEVLDDMLDRLHQPQSNPYFLQDELLELRDTVDEARDDEQDDDHEDT